MNETIDREKKIAEIREAAKKPYWNVFDDARSIANAPEWLRFLLNELDRKDKENRKLREQLNEERAGHDEAVRLLNETRHENNSLKMMAKISNDFATEVKSLRQQLQSAQQEIERLRAELEEAKPKPSDWISVDERQPEKAGKYLVYAERGRDVGLFKNGQWYILGGNFSGTVEWCKAAVTHWVPLPEPPEGVTMD